jgi:hypothetical protein
MGVDYMRIKELVKYLDVEKLAPFHFFNEKSNNKDNASCKHMTDEELDDYKKKTWSSEKIYDDNKLGIYIVDITINEIYELEKKRNPIALNMVTNEISLLTPLMLDEFKLAFGIYVILHEVGHWLDFKASGKSSLEYSLWDSEYRREPTRIADMIYELPDYLYEKREFARMQVEMYKKIPAEKSADKYAYENIKEKLDRMRAYLSVD